jgi:predicted transcriptional regulator
MKHTAKRSADRREVTISFRIDWTLAQKLEHATHGKDISQSQVLRQALREFFQRQEQEAA